MSGRAFAMKLELAQLAERHHVVAAACIIPLSAPTDHPLIMLGLATTSDVDRERMKFGPYCFGRPLRHRGFPPLLYRHDPAQVAGNIESLDYDARGQLLVRAQVDHPEARRCAAFSIAATIHQYEMQNADSAAFHALITRAELTEVSLTDRPANPHALVTQHHRVPPGGEFCKMMQRRLELLIELVDLIPALIKAQSATTQSERGTTQFSQLVTELNRRPP